MSETKCARCRGITYRGTYCSATCEMMATAPADLLYAYDAEQALRVAQLEAERDHYRAAWRRAMAAWRRAMAALDPGTSVMMGDGSVSPAAEPASE